MRNPVAVALAATAVLGVAAFPGGAAAAKKKPLPNCAAKGSTTLELSATGRVYELKGKRYGCLNKKNRRVFLGSDECQNDTAAGAFTLKGDFVGWKATSCGLVAGDQRIVVTNLKTGKQLYSAAAVTDDTVTGSEERNTSVSDYVMKENGSVAWLGVVNRDGTTTVDSAGDAVQVRRLDPDSPAVGDLVDTGNDVNLDSLALAADGFYYRKGATPLFAGLK